MLLGIVGAMQSGIQEHRGVLYQTPAGWQAVTEGQTKLFSPRGLKEPNFLAIVLTPATLSNSETNRKQFVSTVVSANFGATVTFAGDVDENTSGKISVFTQAQTIEIKDLGKQSRLYAMLFVDKRKTLVIVTSSRDSLLTKYRDQVSQFITTLRLKGPATKSKGGTVISPPPKGGGGSDQPR